jgi:hypothetical protein
MTVIDFAEARKTKRRRVLDTTLSGAQDKQRTNDGLATAAAM